MDLAAQTTEVPVLQDGTARTAAQEPGHGGIQIDYAGLTRAIAVRVPRRESTQPEAPATADA